VSPQIKVVNEVLKTDKGSPQSRSESSEGKPNGDKKPILTPGQSPKPPSANQGTPEHWKEANFNSIFGLDTDDEQHQDDAKGRDRNKSCDLALEYPIDRNKSKNASYKAPMGTPTVVVSNHHFSFMFLLF
jgi:hypothetical protein